MSKRFIALLEVAKGQGIEASHFFHTVESSPHLVRMDLVVSWARGDCRTSVLRLLSTQPLIVPFKTHAPLSFCFVSTISPPNGSPDKETHKCDRDDHRKGDDSTLQMSLI